jgi:acyl carrier protein
MVQFRDALRARIALTSGDLEPDASLTRDLGLSSLDAIELVLALEEQFDIDIPEEEAAQIHTVADAIRFILKRQGPRDE